MIAEKNRILFKGKPLSEKHKENMRGRIGKWKRTEKHRRELSERQRGKPAAWYLWPDSDPRKKAIRKKLSEARLKNNPMWNEDSKEKMKETLRKKRWWNNGKNNAFCEECPNGYVKGRIYARKKKPSEKRPS